MKFTFCDKNKNLVDKVQKLFDENKNNKAGLELSTVCGDVLECQKENGGLIVTASNPGFNPGGGLDEVLSKAFPEEWKQAKEFTRTEHLFFAVSCDETIKSSRQIIKRALAGVYGFRHFGLILTGLGTSIGGLDQDVFLGELRCFLRSDLRGSNLSRSNLKRSDLSGSNLRGSNLSYSDFSYSDFRDSDLRRSDLSESDLSCSDLRDSNLSCSNLSCSNLSYSDFRRSDLSDSNLKRSDLRDSDLVFSDLRGSNLSDSDLSGSKINNKKGKELFATSFKKTPKGFIVYKAFGNGIKTTDYSPRQNWKIAKGEYIEENVNPNPTDSCGCGVNFGTLEYIQKNYPGRDHWECLLEFVDMVDMVAPWGSDGKFRCSRLKLVKKIN